MSKLLEDNLTFLKRHPDAQKFHDILKKMGDVHDRKQQDYGSDTDPFANVVSASRLGIIPWRYAVARMQEKFNRLETMIKKGRLVNESAQETFIDLAVYALIALILFEREPEVVEAVHLNVSELALQKSVADFHKKVEEKYGRGNQQAGKSARARTRRRPARTARHPH